MTSIKDVAARANVAVSTVSKVLNNYPNVSEETKKKVNDAINELNFVPNRVAAALSSKQSGRVAILINQSEQTQSIDEVDMEYLKGAILKSQELKLDVITLFFSMLREKTEKEIVTYLKSQNVTGLVIFGLSKDEQKLIKIVNSGEFKSVVVDAPFVNESTSSVWVNQEAASRDVLLEMLSVDSAKKILYLAGKENSFVMEGRLKGVSSVCKEKGIKLTVENADFSEKKAREITLRLGKKFDMIVCASDMMAIGAMRALTDMDIFRPVCGFDGITLMGYAGKRMTTVRQDFEKIAETAVMEVSGLMSGETGKEIITDHEIVRIDYLDVIN